jgi:TonB family protein
VNKNAFRLALLACAVPLAAGANSPPLQPIRSWTLDYGETACAAIRTYGSADAPITLAFRPSPNGAVVRVVVVRPGRAADAYHFDLDAELGATRVKTTGLHFGSTDHKSTVVWINFRREQLEGFRRSTVFVLHGGGDVEGSFALPGMATILDRLDECNADLRKYWNTGDGTPPLSKPATPLKPLASYFSDSDYPDQAIREFESGRSEVMLMVDETGKLKDCLVEESSGNASLDAMTCYVLLQRAKFNPALDASGKPVRSVLTSAVKWKMGA